MALGPGKYDPECGELLERLKARGVILVVLNGDRGTGMACKLPFGETIRTAQILEAVAAEIRKRGVADA
jgi:hypothetical protein